jgi:hypothetical protein
VGAGSAVGVSVGTSVGTGVSVGAGVSVAANAMVVSVGTGTSVGVGGGTGTEVAVKVGSGIRVGGIAGPAARRPPPHASVTQMSRPTGPKNLMDSDDTNTTLFWTLMTRWTTVEQLSTIRGKSKSEASPLTTPEPLHLASIRVSD